MLDCVVQLLVDHGIALRQTGQLIFPALFPATTAADDANIAQTVSLYYDFSGAIDNLYSSLVVSLALSERFGRALVERSVRNTSSRGQACAVCVRWIVVVAWHIWICSSAKTTDATRQLFTVFVEEHLRHEGVEIKEGGGWCAASVTTASPRPMSKVALTKATPTSVVRGAMPAGA